jgi:predicted phage tail protein
MQRSVYLQGELAERFGSKFIVNTDNYADMFKCINANRPDFLAYVRGCAEADIGFIVQTEDGSIDQEDLLIPITKGDVTISLVPAGSKKGMGKILAAVVLVLMIIYMPAMAAETVGTYGQTVNLLSVGGLSGLGQATALLAAQLALAGIQQIMAPDPAVDQDNPTNYLFSGGANNSVEGDPIPLMYGELRVPGRPISVDIAQGGNAIQKGGTQTIINNTVVDSANNTNTAGTKTQEK